MQRKQTIKQFIEKEEQELSQSQVARLSFADQIKYASKMLKPAQDNLRKSSGKKEEEPLSTISEESKLAAPERSSMAPPMTPRTQKQTVMALTHQI